jgi:DUF3000 family protein
MAVRKSTGRPPGRSGGPADDGVDEPPEQFRVALASLRSADVRPEVIVDETPAPQRLAPFAVALAGEVRPAAGDADELATGRLVVLHDPAGQEAWDGPTRVVAYVRAACDPEMAADPLVTEVGWTWLTEALDGRGASYTQASGTVTRVASESFGTMAGAPVSAEIELRASWSPRDDDLGRHLEAWGDLLCQAAGLPPLPAGVATIGAGRKSKRPASRRR